jgi:hypothetical protein
VDPLAAARMLPTAECVVRTRQLLEDPAVAATGRERQPRDSPRGGSPGGSRIAQEQFAIRRMTDTYRLRDLSPLGTTVVNRCPGRRQPDPVRRDEIELHDFTIVFQR